jgi:uncharacterized membrane protein
MWHFKLSGICKTTIIHAIVNLSSYYLLPFYFVIVLSVATCGILNYLEYELKTRTKQMLTLSGAMGSQANTLRPGALINHMLNSGSAAINGEVVSEAGGWWMKVKELASR